MGINKKVRFGIVGTGAIAKIHAACINQIEDAELIAMSSSSEERAKRASENFNIPVFSNYNELIQLKEIDVICIITQSGHHMEPAIAAAMAGKHVFCEKPLEITLERADKMINACKNAGVKLACVFQNRFSADFIEIKDAVKKGFLGKLLMANASINWYRKSEYYKYSPWRGTLEGDGGAALINQGIHTIDLLLNIMGKPESVYGKTKTLVHEIEGEDIANALINFKSGAIGTISAGTALFPGYPERLEIYGEKGSIIFEDGKIINWNVPGHERKISTKPTESISGSSDPMAIGDDLHKAQLIDMIKSIKNNTEPLVNGEEGRKALALIRGIYKSAIQQKEIRI